MYLYNIKNRKRTHALEILPQLCGEQLTNIELTYRLNL